MHALLMAGWLCLPLAPLNPTGQDTISAMNLHVTAGIGSPNGVISAGPSFGVKWEWQVVYPVVVRSSFDYDYSKVNTTLFPNDDLNGVLTDGDLHSATLGLDGLYYHGTNALTGYIGAGVIYGFHYFRADGRTDRDILAQFGVNRITMTQKPGYRLILGLRYHQFYSLEIVVTEVRPDFQFTRNVAGPGFASSNEETRLSNFRVTFGYLWTIKRW